MSRLRLELAVEGKAEAIYVRIILTQLLVRPDPDAGIFKK